MLVPFHRVSLVSVGSIEAVGTRIVIFTVLRIPVHLWGLIYPKSMVVFDHVHICVVV